MAEIAKKEKIVTKVYRLNYVRADELMVMISPFLSTDVGRKRFATSANYQYGISESSTLATGGGGEAAEAVEEAAAAAEPLRPEEREQSSAARCRSPEVPRWPATIC